MLDLLINLTVIACLFIIHESGHYLAGRLIGIPAKHLKIQLFFSVPHVALSDGDGSWISPTDHERYINRLADFSSEEWRDYLFVAGGHATEFFVVVGIAVAAVFTGDGYLLKAASLFVFFSLMLSAIYLLIDLFSTFKYGYPSGDFSAQWMISKGWTLLFYLVYFGGLILVLMFV